MRDASSGQRLGTRWVDRSMRTKGLVVIAVPIAILFIVLGSTSWFTHVDNRAQDVAGHSREIVDAATTLENSLLSAQTGLGDYLLTGDPSFLASYVRAEKALPPQLGRLEALTLDSLPEQISGRAIQRDTDQLVAALARLKDQQPSPAPSAKVRTLLESVNVETDKLLNDISSLTARESSVIASQQSDIHTSNIFLPAIAIAAVVLALAGGVMVSQLFTTGVVRRLRRLERATEDLERGVAPVQVPSGRDEIGRLSTRLLDTTAQLRERAEERDRARAELENILTASPVVSLRYDVGTRRFSYASPNVDRLLGISAEQAIASPRRVMERFHPDSADQFREALGDRTAGHGERLEILMRFRRDPISEDWREAEAVYTLEWGPAGELQGLVAYLIDVSERHVAQRAADERRFLLESIFHASPDTIVVRDISGQVVLGSSPLADVIGTTDTVRDDVDRAVLDELIARCVAGEQSPDPVMTTGRLPGGEQRTYETRARPVFDHSGRVTGTVTISRDVTVRMHLEQSLRHASVEAERASQAKSEFLSRMSHELRTPLNAILGFAQLLEMDELPAEQASSVDQIQVAGRHLLALINEVLDISRIEAGRVSLSTEPVEVERSARRSDDAAGAGRRGGGYRALGRHRRIAVPARARRSPAIAPGAAQSRFQRREVQHPGRLGGVCHRALRRRSGPVRGPRHRARDPTREARPVVPPLLAARSRAFRRRRDGGRSGPVEAARRSHGRRHRRGLVPRTRFDVLGRAPGGPVPGRRRPPPGGERRTPAGLARAAELISGPTAPGPRRRAARGSSCSRSRTTPRTPPWSSKCSPSAPASG